MSQVCELTGKKVFVGNNVSHANNKTRRRWIPNLKNKKYSVHELSQQVTLKLSTRAIRTIDKNGGLTRTLLKIREDELSPRLKKLKRQIRKALS